jgi:hypothetical protein
MPWHRVESINRLCLTNALSCSCSFSQMSTAAATDSTAQVATTEKPNEKEDNSRGIPTAFFIVRLSSAATVTATITTHHVSLTRRCPFSPFALSRRKWRSM